MLSRPCASSRMPVRTPPRRSTARVRDGRDGENVMDAIEREAKEGQQPLWVVLIGHGTYDGRAAKFNLRGEDVSDAELAAWLEPCRRPLAVINCASASAPRSCSRGTRRTRRYRS